MSIEHHNYNNHQTLVTWMDYTQGGFPNEIKTNYQNKISYFGFNFIRKSTFSFTGKAFDQICWRKVFQSLCLLMSVRKNSNRFERNLSPTKI